MVYSLRLASLSLAAGLTLLLGGLNTPAIANGRTAADWSDTEKQGFLNGCQSRANPPGVSEQQLPAYCQCVLNALVRNAVPLSDINAIRTNPNPREWSPDVRQAMVSCLPRR
ncbi:hypothetical protein [Spirulina major]|uniref:hypothetical protein n=1 Tax=Spirulina major TaxID=270636 RepID=UPI000933D2EE|nr:hypothetical protein [Spirulina major]